MKPKFLVPALFIALSVMMVMSGAVIAGLTQSDLPTGPVPGKYIIVFKDGINPAAAAKNLGIKHGLRIGHVYSHAIKGCAASIPEGMLEAIERDPSVEYVEQDIYVQALADRVPWGVDRIDADLVWSYNTGAGVKVAIIDTGIDYTHPDLDANYRGGYDFANDDADPFDDNGHGTHCAGIIAAEKDNIDYIEGDVVGVAPEAELYAVKVLNKFGSGFLSDVISGIEWSVLNGMQVISMSLGASADIEALEDACNTARSAGLVLVAAAGNEGDGDPDTTEYLYPAAYDSVIAVGATDRNNEAPSWSNSGYYLELAAPGVGIYSTLPTSPQAWLTKTYGLNYGTLSGTSMACPHVAGTAALVIASDPSLTNEQVRSLLQSTADELGPDTVYGYGLVDAEEAASGEDSIDPTFTVTASPDPATTGPVTITVTASEALTGAPTVNVTQSGQITSTEVTMTLTSGTTYTGTYTVVTGYDGAATIEVSGTDLSDNMGTGTGSFLVDTTPPAQVSDVTVYTISSSQLDISWTANTELDIDHYKVYRRTTSGVYDDPVASPTTNSYSDTGLTASTTYCYEVTAVDVAGNEGAASLEASGTTNEAPAGDTMHVASIDIILKTAGINTSASATVTIVDASGNPVEGATVSGQWSDATSDADSGITDANGQVTVGSDRVKRAPSGTTFIFTVTDVTHPNYDYPELEPADQPSNSITL